MPDEKQSTNTTSTSTPGDDASTQPIQDSPSSSPPSDTFAPNTTQPQDEEPKSESPSDASAPKPVVTSSQVPQKYGGKKIIATIFGVLLLIGGVAAGVILVQQSAELRERAASGKECSHSPDCVLMDEPGNSGSTPFGRIIDHIFITAQDSFRYEPGETNDGCYHVVIHDNNLSWERVGEGPSCKDISNIQVWLGPEKEEELKWSINQVCDGFNVKVSGKHEGFTAKADFSSTGSPGTWQSEQSWQINAGDANTYSFNFDPIPKAGWWLRIRILYKDKQVAAVEEHILDCGKPTEPPPPPPTVPPLSARCLDIKIYDTDWNLLSPSQIEALSEGATIRLAVSGTATLGFFDKARFIVNGVGLPETSVTKPGSDLFYSEYSLPGNTTSFSVNAQLHHSSLGWF